MLFSSEAPVLAGVESLHAAFEQGSESTSALRCGSSLVFSFFQTGPRNASQEHVERDATGCIGFLVKRVDFKFVSGNRKISRTQPKEFTMLSNRAALILAAALVFSLAGMASGQTQLNAAPPAPQSQAVQASEPAKAKAAQPNLGKKKAAEKTTVTGSHVRDQNPTTQSRTTVITTDQMQASGQVSTR